MAACIICAHAKNGKNGRKNDIQYKTLYRKSTIINMMIIIFKNLQK